MDSKILASKKFPECVSEALKLIRQNHTRFNRLEMSHLAFDYVFYCDYDKTQNKWTKKTNAMQELQIVDSVINFLESEQSESIRDLIFDILFGDLYNHQSITKVFLQLILSYAISLEAKCTLDCVAKWLITNIGNEILQSVFDQVLRDHFLLTNHEQKMIPQHLANLCQLAPLFSSLFMAIVLDMIANSLISDQEKLLDKILSLFEMWMGTNPALPIMALKLNFSHASSYMLNPINGLIYLTLIYPVKFLMDKFDSFEVDFLPTEKSVNQLISKVHFMTMKLIRDLALFLNNALPNDQSLQLVNLKSLESILKKLSDYDQSFIEKSAKTETQSKKKKKESTFFKIRSQTLDRLAQFLELCWQFNFIQMNKEEVRILYDKILGNNFAKTELHIYRQDNQEIDDEFSFIDLVLSA